MATVIISTEKISSASAPVITAWLRTLSVPKKNVKVIVSTPR